MVVEEIVLEEGYEMSGKLIKDLDLPPKTMVATVLRDRRILIPRGDLALFAGDKVLFISEADQAGEAEGPTERE